MRLPRLYINANSLYFQIKHKGHRYVIYPGIMLTHRVTWSQKEQDCHVNSNFEFEYGTAEHGQIDRDIARINFEVNKVRHEMQENLSYFRKTGDIRFIRDIQDGKGEIIKTVSQAVDRYAKGRSGYRGAKCIFDKHLQTFKGVKSVNIDLDEFYHHLLKFVSNSSAHIVITLVRTALKKVDGVVREVNMKPVHYKENSILTKEEVQSIFNDEQLTQKYRDVCRVLYHLCLRFSELSQIHYKQGMEKIEIYQPKTGKLKLISLNGKKELQESLQRLKIVSYTGFTTWMMEKLKDRPYLQRICSDNLPIGEKVRSHSFRQSSATHAIEGGADIKLVSKNMLNHSDIAVTLRSYYIPEEKDPFDFLK